MAECRLSTLEPRAELARQLEVDIANMKAEIGRIRAENALLADTNEMQAKIIKSRSCSPALGHEVTFRETVTTRSRSPSPCAGPCGGLGLCSPSPYSDSTERTVETTTVIDHRSCSPRPVQCSSSSSSLLNCSRPFLHQSTCTMNIREPPKMISPLSPTHCTQVIRQESLTSRFADMYWRDRMNAMDLLRHYSSFENNQKIIFAALQVLFHLLF